MITSWFELALSGGAHSIGTHNLRDLKGGALNHGCLWVMTPRQMTKEWKSVR